MKKIFVVYRYETDDDFSKRAECAFDNLADALEFVQNMNEVMLPYHITFDYVPVSIFKKSISV